MVTGKMPEMSRSGMAEIKEGISKSPNKPSNFDPQPTWVLTKCMGQLMQVIRNLIRKLITVNDARVFETGHHNCAAQKIWVR